MLAIGSEQREFGAAISCSMPGDVADAGYIVQRGAFRVEDGGAEIIAGPRRPDRRARADRRDAAAVERDRDRKFHGHQIARSLLARARK